MKKDIVMIALVLFILSFSVTLSYQGYETKNPATTQVILCFECDDSFIAGAEIELYKGEDLEFITKTYSDANGNVILDLLPDTYTATAITRYGDVGDGYAGSIEFRVETDTPTQSVFVPMKLKSDHSTSVKIGPSSTSDYPAGLVEIDLEGDDYNVPLLISPEVVEERFDEFQESTDSETIWFGLYLYGIVSTTTSYDEWHPVALIDSEYGLTHKMDMSYYEDVSMSLSSEIKYAGVTGSYSYSTSLSYSHGDDNPIICSNGQSKSRLSEFKHVYQTGSLYALVWNSWLQQYVPDYRGPFQREWIDEWYTLSYDLQTGWAAGISETREIYRGEWAASTSAWIAMSSSSSMSLGFSVSRGDTFGTSAKIQTTIDHAVKANHQLIWSRPTSTTNLRIFSGNLFDINTYTYSTSGGGGCPFVSEWNGAEFVLDNNILPQAEIYGTETDWVDRYKLENSLELTDSGYLLRVSEFENEHSFIDSANLLAVTHDAGTNIAVSPTGEILAYNKPKAPISVISEGGESFLKEVKHEDDSYFSGDTGDVLYCSFKTNSFDNGARLVLRADAVVKESIHIDILTSSGWVEVGVVIPRINWAHEIVSLDEFLQMVPDSGLIDLRLRWTANHKLDFIGLDTKPAPEFDIVSLSLIGAWHNIHGNALDITRYADDVYSELLPGEELVFTFEGRELRKHRVSFVFVVEGRYYSL